MEFGDVIDAAWRRSEVVSVKMDIQDDGGSVSSSVELKDLRERADRLSEELQTLQETSENVDITDESDNTDDINEVIKRYSIENTEDYNDDGSLNEQDLELVSKIIGDPEVNERLEQKLQKRDNMELQKAIDDALDMIKNFKPKRPVVEQPIYPDLNLKGEKFFRSRRGGTYWQMPFRSKDFLEDQNLG